ncbi:hypothetical protein BH11BAC4_BH11BAC4_27600 [soil metagenome]
MKKIAVISLICIVSFFQYCSSSKKLVTKPPPPKSIAYLSDIQPTIAANCSPCHIPPGGNKVALNSYAAAKAAIDNMISRIKKNPGERGFMPFKHSKLSDSVIHIFDEWKRTGMLEK